MFKHRFIKNFKIKKMKIVKLAAAAAVLTSGLAFYSYNMKPVNAPNAIISEAKAPLVSDYHGYTVDVANSSVAWTGSKANGKHNGIISLKSGAFKLHDGVLGGGSFEIDMNSLVCKDLEGKGKEGLEGHLKAPDFFDVAKNPSATFAITAMTAIENVKASTDVDAPTHEIAGNLTLKGVTKNVSFPAKVVDQNGAFALKANFNIDRTQWGIVYGEGKVAKEINLVLDIKASSK